MDVLTDLIATFRRATIILAIEHCDLREVLLTGYTPPSIPKSTSDRVVLAAAALNMVSPDNFAWIEPYRALANQKSLWERLVALIAHQHTYLQLAKTVNSLQGASVTSPAEQLESSPDEYVAFLQGVDASHWEHAKWFAQRPEFDDARHLVDLGGGLGTFSKAWTEISEGRSATVVDLPRIEGFGTVSRQEEDIAFCGGDLTNLTSLPTGDVYLLANVLHLLPDWRTVLRAVVSLVPNSSRICVMEADLYGDPGRLFDLQVHLRSGGIGGLIPPDLITEEFESVGLTKIQQSTFSDVHDPFQRCYHFWIGTNTNNDRSR